MKSIYILLITLPMFAIAAELPKDRIFGPEEYQAYTSNTKGCGYLNGSLRLAAKENGYDLILDPGFDLSTFQVCDQPAEFRGDNMLEVTDVMAQYYSDCLSIVVDRQNKQIRIRPKAGTIHVTSEHKSTNEYMVNGKMVYSNPSSESKDRWVCVKDASAADAWVLKVFEALKN